MINIVCDMNCNNFGNHFYVVGLERILKQDKYSYINKNCCYPKKFCYRAKVNDIYRTYKYSEAIDILIPKDYVKWQKNRFGK